MKKVYLYGNWKMNMLPDEGEAFCRSLANRITGNLYGSDIVDICLFPPFLAIPSVLKALPGAPVSAGAQDGYFEDRGAYTGAVSMEMVRSVGCSHVLVGHSERCHIFGDSDEIVAKKLRKALDVGLKAVLCFGETLEEREGGKTIPWCRTSFVQPSYPCRKAMPKISYLPMNLYGLSGPGKTQAPMTPRRSVPLRRNWPLRLSAARTGFPYCTEEVSRIQTRESFFPGRTFTAPWWAERP